MLNQNFSWNSAELTKFLSPSATGPLDHKSYMVTVVYFSGFFEIDRLYDLKVSNVIRKLKTHISRYGIPDEVMTDSGSQYTSREFKNLAKEYRFNHVTTSPYHHQSNGRAESAVKEAKKILKKTAASKSNPYLALLAHLNTPQEGFSTSPAQCLFSRRTKTNLPLSSNLLKPSVAEDTLKKDKPGISFKFDTVWINETNCFVLLLFSPFCRVRYYSYITCVVNFEKGKAKI